MRVLGVDPGLTRCGVAVVEGSRSPMLLHVSVVRTDADLDTPRRLVTIEAELDALIERWLPDVVAVERVFAQNNLNTVIGTAQAAGTAMMVGARRGIPVAEHTPSEIKAAITGSGRADKAQITTMVTRILSLDAPPRPADAADAAALAICHLWRGATKNRITEAVAARGRQRPDLEARAQEIAERQRRAVSQARAKATASTNARTGIRKPASRGRTTT